MRKQSHRHIALLAAMLSCVAVFAQYPAGTNKIRLGAQTTGDGLVYRGRVADTTTIKPANINNAFYIQDTINDRLYRYIKTAGGWQPVQGKVQQLGVGADKANGATLYLSGTDTETSTGLVVVDGLSSLRLPGVNNTVVGIVTVTTVQHGVTITGTGLAVISETPGEDGEITVSVVIPSGYITGAMLAAGAVDSVTTISVTDATTQDTTYVIVNTLNALQLPWDGTNVIGSVSAGSGIKNAVYLSVNGKNILIQGGGAMSMTANDAGDILTITSATNVAISQATGVGKAYSVVDAISTLRLPWDGSAVLGVTEEFLSNDVTLTINDTTVTFKVGVTDGDKGDITVSGNSWQIDESAVGWSELSQAVKDSISAAAFTMPVDSILFTTNAENTAVEGELTYNNQSGTLHLGMTGGIEIPIGQGEAHMVRNTTGTTIAKGKVVYIVGATGQRPLVALANAKAEVSSSVTFGITAEAIENNDTGFVFTSGYIKGINTSSFTEGEALWLDTVAGNFTHDKPTAPVHAVLVGYVITKKNNGTIFVKIQNGYELGELHDVNTQGRITGDILRFTGSIWQEGKDTSIYNMDGRLKGNRTVIMDNFQLMLKDSATAVDAVDLRSTYAGVKNTTTGNFTTVDQYGIFNENTIYGDNTGIYLSDGQITMRGNTSANSSGIGPDLVIAENGRVKFRVSAPGSVDSLYGKNSSGELTATLNNIASKLNAADTASLSNRINTKLNISDTTAMLSTYLKKVDTLSLSNRINTKLNISDTTAMLSTYYDRRDTVPVSNGGTGLGNYGGPGRVPYSTGALGTGLQFDTTFFVDPTNRNFIWGGGARNGTDNVYIGGSGTVLTRTNNGVGNIGIGINNMTYANSTAFYNVSIGQSAGINITTGDENALLGSDAGSEINTGSRNVYIGSGAGRFNSSGSNNIAIGANIYSPTNPANRTLTIGNIIFGQNMDSTGTAIPVNGRVGIKVASPTRDFHVVGEMRVTDLDTDVTPTRIVGADATGVLDTITLGSGLSLSGGTLSSTATIQNDTVRNKERHYFSMPVFKQKDTVTNNFDNADYVVIPSDLQGWCIRTMSAKGFSGAGTVSLELYVDNSLQATLSSIGNGHAFLTPQNISIGSGSIVHLKTVSLSGTLIGLTSTLQIQRTCN